jgi:hypothetical protein
MRQSGEDLTSTEWFALVIERPGSGAPGLATIDSPRAPPGVACTHWLYTFIECKSMAQPIPKQSTGNRETREIREIFGDTVPLPFAWLAFLAVTH